MTKEEIHTIIKNTLLSDAIGIITEKILAGIRISKEEGLLLYEQGEIGFLGMLANWINSEKNGKNIYYNKNIHIEPTNYCVNKCKFCSYRKNPGEPGFWDYSIQEILNIISQHYKNNITEIHIVGGVHPDRNLYYYADLLKQIKSNFPKLFIKAFTAVELFYMIEKAKISLYDGLVILKKNGLDSIPGGGAEIFDKKIRSKICDEKASAEQWLEVHKTAHLAGIPSNATMLYGHIETYEQRIDHLLQLRNLQDNTKGFQAFIPLKYRNKNNELSHLKEVTLTEDLKNIAVTRIFLDNFQHIKAYWPMLGKEATEIALTFGVDDIDGTIEDTKPTLSIEEIKNMVKNAGKEAIERDTVYGIVSE